MINNFYEIFLRERAIFLKNAIKSTKDSLKKAFCLKFSLQIEREEGRDVEI
jgi:hypothetical protein